MPTSPRYALIELDLPDSRVLGSVSGSPIVTDEAFFGFEHPMAEARVIGGHASMRLRRALPLRPDVAARYSAVFGAVPAGQLRRGFQAYLENERAAPFRTFLHYNSWYDIGYFTPYTEAEALSVIRAYGEHLVKARSVQMDSFLFDDGWDDTSRLWQFSKDFPSGFAPLRDATAKIGAAPGVWLSPWGGYGPPREARLATARAAGFEVDEQGLALSGPRYFALFHDTTVNLLRRYGINQFKLDGTGSADKVTPGSEFDSDFAAAIALIGDLRAIKPDLFINLTTGTWPSPFWLMTADSIWRGGDDHSFAGVGSDRQRWITYRDADTYGGIVRLGPLFPLNSLMLHGIIFARKAQGLDHAADGDFEDEVRSYFASGTGLAGAVRLARPAEREELGRSRRGRKVGPHPRGRAARQSLDRRRPGARRSVRLGCVGARAGDACAAQSRRPASPIRTRHRCGARAAGHRAARVARDAGVRHRDFAALASRRDVVLTLQPFEVRVWELSPADVPRR